MSWPALPIRYRVGILIRDFPWHRFVDWNSRRILGYAATVISLSGIYWLIYYTFCRLMPGTPANPGIGVQTFTEYGILGMMIVGVITFILANICFILTHIPYLLGGPWILDGLGPYMRRQIREILRHDSVVRRKKLRYIRLPAIEYIRRWQMEVIFAYIVGVMTSLLSLSIFFALYDDYSSKLLLSDEPIHVFADLLNIFTGRTESGALIPIWSIPILKLYGFYLLGIAFSFLAGARYYVYARLDAELIDLCNQPLPSEG